MCSSDLEELTSRPILDFIVEEDRPMVAENIRRRLEGDVQQIRYNLRMLQKDGTAILVEAHGSRSEYNGRPAILGMLIDVTDRKKVEEMLRESEETTRLVIENSLDAAVGMNSGGQITAWNAQAEVIFGWSRQEVIDKPLADIIIPTQFRDAHRRGLERFLTTHEAHVLNKRANFKSKRAVGSYNALSSLALDNLGCFRPYLPCWLRFIAVLFFMTGFSDLECLSETCESTSRLPGGSGAPSVMFWLPFMRAGNRIV